MGYHYKSLLKRDQNTADAYHWCREKWPEGLKRTWTSWYDIFRGREFRFSRKGDFVEFMLTWKNNNDT